MAPRKQAERTADTKARLMDATIESLFELGYAGASTTDIAERAGVSRGAQLHHYPTKAALMAEAIAHVFTRRHEEFRASLAAGASLHDVVAGLWRIYSGKTFFAWIELVVAARTDAVLRAQLREVDDRFFEEAKRTCRVLMGLRDDEDERRVAALTRMVLAVLDGVALNHTLGGREDTTAAVLEELESLLGALRAR